MARYKGHQGEVAVGADTIGEVESFDLELSVGELDANIMGSDWTDVEAGQSSGSGSVSVLRDPSDAGQAALVMGTKVTLNLYPEGNTAGLTLITGSFLITSQSISVSVGDLVKDTFNVRNAGAVTISAVPI